MKIVKCWDIQSWDGGDRHNHKFYVASKSEKDAYLKVNTYDIAIEREFVIFDTLSEQASFKNGQIRKEALAKLTDIERKCLGV